eukprot:gene5926-9756_t
MGKLYLFLCEDEDSKDLRQFCLSHEFDYFEVDTDENKSYSQFATDLSKQTTFPQIFFGKTYFGNFKDLVELEKKEGTEKMKLFIKESTEKAENWQEIENKARESMTSDEHSSIEKEDKKEDLTPFQEVGQVINLMVDPKKGIEIKTRMYHLKNYHHCFVGSDFVDWLMKNYKNLKTREEALEYGIYLMDNHAFVHVCGSEPFRDGEFFYRLHEHENEDVLNQHRIFTEITRPATEVAKSIKKLLLKLKGQFMSENGKLVDYTKLRDSDLFKEFKNEITELQRVDIVIMDKNEKKAFFLNLYNSMVIHGLIHYGSPKNSAQRNRFFNSVTYNIQGNLYSLNDIEHGILRCNRYPPGSLSRRLKNNDARKININTRFDPRIHFALNCGAKSCPPIRVYSATKLDKELDISANGFMDAEVEIEKNTVKLSKLFSWYYSDFGSNDREVLTFVHKYLTDDGLKNKVEELLQKKNFTLKYNSYDWGTNNT